MRSLVVLVKMVVSNPGWKAGVSLLEVLGETIDDN